MGFDNGSISFMLCNLSRPLPDDALERFAANRAPDVTHVLDEPQVGWVSGRGLLESRIDEVTSKPGGYYHVNLRIAQRKIPASLFRAHCQLEELALMQAEQTQFLNRKQKKEIREAITERLLKDMPPTLSNIEIVIDSARDVLYLGATSDGQVDTFLSHFHNAFGFEPKRLTAEAVAQDVFTENPAYLRTLDLSPSGSRPDPEPTLGRDFATWLWFHQEVNGGAVEVERFGQFQLMVEGPLTFAATDPEATETVLRKGMPTISAEAAVALAEGKKLRQARFTLVREEEAWTFNFDADKFLMRGMKLPVGEQLEPQSYFQERVMFLHAFRAAWLRYFEVYLEQLTDADKWAKLEPAMQKWVADMQNG